MAEPRPNAFLEHIRSQLAEENAGSLTDRELLQQFAARQDEIAFKALLRRHGPMVLRVCQQILERREDAEDVFQATFLVLARKAGSLSWRESVGTWLYEVAHRLAREVRRKHIRQHIREARARARPVEDPLAEITGRELVAILDEELSSLPERYRAPLLLCCVEGKSGDEAARHLGCSPSTLKRRLRSARELLQGRLNRRGFVLSSAILTALLLHLASATVPLSLAATTARAAVLTTSGQPLTAGLVSASAVELANGLARAMFLAKLKAGLAVLLVLGGLTAGSTLGRPGPVRNPVAPLASATSGDEVARPSPWHWSGPPVTATIETTLHTAAGQIRQFAFDGDPETYFASEQDAGPADHFTLVFDQPVAVWGAIVTTGRPDGGDRLEAGTLEVSADGQTFEPLATFVGGTARGDPEGRRLRAVRIRPGAGPAQPLVVSEFTLASDPPVAVFKYPVEFVVDVADAPELKAWAERAARVCERAFPMINEELRSDGYQPRTQITIALRHDYTAAPAEASGGRITGSVQYFREKPDDLGALIHTITYVVQRYRSRHNPRWLVSGVADYIRFFKYEPGKLGPIDPNRASYDGGYQMTAAFLAYLVENYDKEIVRKLNAVMREGEYRETVWTELTGKTVQQLGAEWRASLAH